MSNWLDEVDKVNVAPYDYERNNTCFEQTNFDYNGCYSKDYDIADSANIKFKVIGYC